MGSKKNDLVNVWVATSLDEELKNIQKRLELEFGKSTYADATRILGKTLKQRNLFQNLEFYNVQTPRRRGERITFDWGFKL